MSSSSDDIVERTVGLLWSLWAEAGVSGWTRAHADVALDVEPLIVLTAAVGDADPRLRDEATDWCIRYGRLVSTVRLKNVRKLVVDAGDAFDEFAATVNAHGKMAWPTQARPRRFKPSERSELDLVRPSLIQLRSRAIFGVAARAEILTTYALEPKATFTITKLADRIHFGRRITVEALDLLERAHVLGLADEAPSRTYRSIRGDEVRALLAPIPKHVVLWAHALPVVHAIWDVALLAGQRSQVVRAVEAQKRLAAVDGHILRAGLPHVPTLDATAAAWTRFTSWANDVLGLLSSG